MVSTPDCSLTRYHSSTLYIVFGNFYRFSKKSKLLMPKNAMNKINSFYYAADVILMFHMAYKYGIKFCLKGGENQNHVY